MRINGQWSVVSRQWRKVTDHGPRTTGISAFTLIELMVVVGIIALVMAIGIPFMANLVNGGKGVNRAVRDVQEVCSNARGLAIMRQGRAELRVRPRDGVFEIGAGGGDGGPSRMFSPDVSGKDWRMQDRRSSAASESSGSSVKLPEGVVIEALGINGEDWTDEDSAAVTFYPDGTSDEMRVILFRPETGERRYLFLEVVTGLADMVETDLQKFTGVH